MKQLVAVTKQLLADGDTPVSAYLKLCGDKEYSFLLESAEGVDSIGRYSIVAWDPLLTMLLDSGAVVIGRDGEQSRHRPEEFFDLARQTMDNLACQDLPRLGYVGYEAVRLMERLPASHHHHLPVANLCFPTRFVIFDHLKRSMTLVAMAASRQEAQAKIDQAQAALGAALVMPNGKGSLTVSEPPKEPFLDAVERAKHYILEGDIFQVVLSSQYTGTTDVDPLSVYRRLRVKSPSPYMFFIKLPGCTLVGSSPEMLVRLKEGRLEIRPIAGTRGRSADPEEDLRLEQEMLDSPKERAEHVMLVDLARNDAGRVCAYGSVKVAPYMTVERYSHVMHIVSQVTGSLDPKVDVWDAFQAAFPAGTLSGAPKVRAMEIIDELEPVARGPYGGGIGSFGPGPQMDTCIGIRLIQFEGERYTVHVGAGIVADSDPEMEYQEINHKAAQAIASLRAAAEGTL